VLLPKLGAWRCCCELLPIPQTTNRAEQAERWGLITQIPKIPLAAANGRSPTTIAAKARAR